jgi:preprotein translocase subunit SecG
MLTLAQLSGVVIGLLVVGFFFLCLILILTVLIQKPQGGGLSGAFGSGAGSGQTAFGARTGDALTVATISIFVIYILAAIGLNYIVRPTIAAPPGPEARPTGQVAPDAPPATGTTPAPIQPTPAPAPVEPASTPVTEPGQSEPAPAAPGSDEPAGADPNPGEPAPGEG